MSSQATELRDIIETAWQFDASTTDANLYRLSKEPMDTQEGDAFNMREIVTFWDRKQVEGNEQPKVLVVERINEADDENRIGYPQYTEFADLYEITLLYRVVDVQEPSYSEALLDIENMAVELTRILEIEFGSGIFATYFRMHFAWDRADITDSAQPELVRRLRMTLEKLEGAGVDEDLLLHGYNGVFGFGSPATFTYTSAYNVRMSGGFRQTAELVTNNSGIAKRASGMYTGLVEAEMYAKREYVSGGEPSDINVMAALDAFGELPVVTLSYLSAANDGSTVTDAVKCNIIDWQRLYDTQDLVVYRITGEIIEPPTISSTPPTP